MMKVITENPVRTNLAVFRCLFMYHQEIELRNYVDIKCSGHNAFLE